MVSAAGQLCNVGTGAAMSTYLLWIATRHDPRSTRNYTKFDRSDEADGVCGAHDSCIIAGMEEHAYCCPVRDVYGDVVLINNQPMELACCTA